MAKIQFHKANALPPSPTSADDGIWLIADGANNYKHYVISGGDVKELTVDGASITLEQARQNGNVLEGDVIIENVSSGQYYTGFISEGASSKISFTDEDTVRINYSVDDVESFINISSGNAMLGLNDYDLGSQIYIQANYTGGEPAIMVGAGGSTTTKGLIGSREFNKQGDRKAYAQIADVEDAMEWSQADW